jgi:hypothetical protein
MADQPVTGSATEVEAGVPNGVVTFLFTDVSATISNAA